MMAGGLFIGGLWLVYLAGRSTFTADEKKFLAGIGGKVAAGLRHRLSRRRLWAASVQPKRSKAGLRNASALQVLCRAFAGYGWLALVAVAVLLGRIRRIRQSRRRLARLGRRSGCRADRDHVHRLPRRRARPHPAQQGLRRLGSRPSSPTGGSGPFLVLFVAGLGVIGWLVSVVARAKKSMEGAA
jgi:hypothetical protein